MKVFISWSGTKSHRVAMIFREWLPSVIQSLEPYVSSEDIDKGARWSTDIANELEDSTFGILCVTKDNLEAPWISFEAGALSKTMDKSFVTPFLFDIKRSEVNGPILQFQSTIFEREDIKKLVTTLNKACAENGISDSMLDKAFDVWYPTLEKELNILHDTEEDQCEAMPEDTEAHMSSIIEELLELSRDNQKLLRNPDNRTSGILEGLDKKLDFAIDRIERNANIEERRMLRRNKSMYMDELIHSIIPKFQPQYAFLMLLSIFQDDFLWIYNAGKSLLDMLNSKAPKENKLHSIADFRYLVDFTLDHPAVRDYYLRRRDSFGLIKDSAYMLIELLHHLEEIYIK